VIITYGVIDLATSSSLLNASSFSIMGRNWELRIEAIGELCSFIYGSSNELPRYEEAAPFEIYISTLAVEDPEARISLVYEILSGTPYYFDFLRSATGES